nr:unnamed protein product [Spirometra erinaceieuropaei]
MSLPQAELFEDKLPLIRSCPALNEIRLAQDIKDLTIEVKNGDVLYAHRIILAARIPSLRAALSGSLGEGNSILRWPTMPLRLASSLVQYVYTGQVELSQVNVSGMVTLARMLKMPDLENWGTSFMIKWVNVENLASAWDFAKSLNICPLMQACVNLMATQFNSFVSSNLFVRLPADTVISLLRIDNLSVESEEQVFEAIASWVGACTEDVNERLKLHAPNMLKEVRWCQTTLQFRKHLTDTHPMFQNGFECAKFMLQVEQWMSFADKDKPQCPFNQHRRPTLSFFVFGRDKDQDRCSVLKLDSDLKKEKRFADTERRKFASYSAVGESIFVVGGENDSQVGLTSVEEFLAGEQRWRKRAALAVGRSAHAAAVMKVDSAAADEESQERTLIGVFGGSSIEGGTWANLSSCEVYDVSQDRWCKLPDLREKRNGPAAVCLPGDNRVFVFGGRGGSSALASVEFCHLRADWQEKAISASTADFWLQAAPMRTARVYLAATHFRGRVIVAGGTNANKVVNVVEMFTPPDATCPLGQWTDLAAMMQPRRYFALLATTDAVFALGNMSAADNTIEVFTAPGVSLRVTPTFGLSKWLYQRFRFLTKGSEWTVKSAEEFLKSIRNLEIEPDEMTVSFDVVSLFTSIPAGLAISAIDEHLQEKYDDFG